MSCENINCLWIVDTSAHYEYPIQITFSSENVKTFGDLKLEEFFAAEFRTNKPKLQEFDKCPVRVKAIGSYKVLYTRNGRILHPEMPIESLTDGQGQTPSNALFWQRYSNNYPRVEAWVTLNGKNLALIEMGVVPKYVFHLKQEVAKYYTVACAKSLGTSATTNPLTEQDLFTDQYADDVLLVNIGGNTPETAIDFHLVRNE